MSSGVGFVDAHSSELRRPHIILTADDHNPKEIDDGIIVDRIDARYEAYRVGVCVVDTSRLYENPHVTAMAFENAKARYNERAKGRIEQYVPMIDEDIIRTLEFKEGNVRDALILWFTAHKNARPSDLSIEFGQVEVAANYTYKRFDSLDRHEDKYGKYGRAAAFIMRNLSDVQAAEGDPDLGRQNEIGVLLDRRKKLGTDASGRRGSKINAAYMVAANHLIGRTFAHEGRAAIYRIFGPSAEMYAEENVFDIWLPNDVATYSMLPGPHNALRLDPYARSTSPLRRLEDYINLYHLRLLYEGKQPLLADVVRMGEGVRELNGLIVQHAARRVVQDSGMPLMNRFSISAGLAA